MVVENLAHNLDRHGHTVLRFERSSAEIDHMRCGQLRAFFSGIYSPSSRRRFAQYLREHRPDLVHVHNLFPLISPSALLESRRQKIPAVMTLHNFRLICPNGLLLRNGAICHDCLGGHEYRCVTRNCERNAAKSLGYALRTGIARRMRWFLDNVSQFICLTRFQRDLYVNEGFQPDRCSVIPNSVPGEFIEASAQARSCRTEDSYVGYVGRLSPEKDIPTLLEAARRLPQIPFKIAGTLARMPELAEGAPQNVEFVGQLDRRALARFYSEMRVFVFATRYYEGLPTVLLEAMAFSLPTVSTRLGGIPEVVGEEQTGLLYGAGDSVDLAIKINKLWDEPELATQMGRAGRAKVLRDYHPDVVYAQHMAVYERVLSS